MIKEYTTGDWTASQYDGLVGRVEFRISWRAQSHTTKPWALVVTYEPGHSSTHFAGYYETPAKAKAAALEYEKAVRR